MNCKARLYLVLVLVFCWIGKSPMCASGASAAWSRMYGDGFNRSVANSLQQTSDGGYVVFGSTAASGMGASDMWVLKLDKLGSIQWQKTIGSFFFDEGYSGLQTSDGGFVVVGEFSDGSDKLSVWLTKLDSMGDLQWQRVFRDSGNNRVYTIQQTSDGGYVMGGETASFGPSGAWVIKLDSSGNVQWQKILGSGFYAQFRSVQQTADGGFILAGFGYFAGIEAWIVKLDSSGNVQWQKTYGGAGFETATSVQKTSDGGYIFAGGTSSFSPDLNAWVVKLNSTGAVQWEKTYSAVDYDYAQAIQITSDGGYIVAGGSRSFGASLEDGLLFKLNSTGDVEWQKNIAGPSQDFLNAVQQTSDDGYITGGFHSNSDLWLLKFNKNGNVDPSCAFITDTSITPANSSATVANTSEIPTDTTSVALNGGTSGYGSNVTETLQCSNPEATCVFQDDFADSVLDLAKWTVLKPTFLENAGVLRAVPDTKKAVILGTGFAGCSNCSLQTTMTTEGGTIDIISILGWYVDKKNGIELMMKGKSDAWILKYKLNGTIVVKRKVKRTIDPNVLYGVELTYDGTALHVFVDGSEIINAPAPPPPAGIFGFQAKTLNAASFTNVCVR